MSGLSATYHKTALDGQFLSTNKVVFSENGTSSTTKIPSVNVTSWSAATSAVPSVKSTSARIESSATSSCTITHVMITTSADVPLTNWLALTPSKTLDAGDYLFFDVGGITVSSANA